MKLSDVRKGNFADVLRFLEESVDHGVETMSKAEFRYLSDYERGIYAAFKWMKQQISLSEIYAGVDTSEVTSC